MIQYCYNSIQFNSVYLPIKGPQTTCSWGGNFMDKGTPQKPKTLIPHEIC